MYKKFMIELKIGKCKYQTEYFIVIKQGNNLTSTLFIIIRIFIRTTGKEVKE